MSELREPGQSWDYEGHRVIVGRLYSNAAYGRYCQVTHVSPDTIGLMYDDGKEVTVKREDISIMLNRLISLTDESAQEESERLREQADWIDKVLKSNREKVCRAIEDLIG